MSLEEISFYKPFVEDFFRCLKTISLEDRHQYMNVFFEEWPHLKEDDRFAQFLFASLAKAMHKLNTPWYPEFDLLLPWRHFFDTIATGNEAVKISDQDRKATRSVVSFTVTRTSETMSRRCKHRSPVPVWTQPANSRQK